MTTKFTSRSILLALGLGFTLAAACIDESVLENEDCASNKDCFNGQECVRTDYQLNVTASKVGWCRPEGDACAAGQQPGCECGVDATRFLCESLQDGTPLCPSTQDASCLCVFPEDVEGAVDGATSCPSGT